MAASSFPFPCRHAINIDIDMAATTLVIHILDPLAEGGLSVRRWCAFRRPRWLSIGQPYSSHFGPQRFPPTRDPSMFLMFIDQDAIQHQAHQPLLPRPPRLPLHSPSSTVACPALATLGATSACTTPTALVQPTHSPRMIIVYTVMTLKVTCGVPACMTTAVKSRKKKQRQPSNCDGE